MTAYLRFLEPTTTPTLTWWRSPRLSLILPASNRAKSSGIPCSSIELSLQHRVFFNMVKNALEADEGDLFRLSLNVLQEPPVRWLHVHLDQGQGGSRAWQG